MKRQEMHRFVQYSLLGAGTLLIDMALLFVLAGGLGMNYLGAAALAFFVAVSLNYLLSRRFVFKGTSRTQTTGYVYFLMIAAFGMLLVTAGMYVLVEKWGLYYMISRILISCVTGIWNYSMNLFFNFRVAGFYVD